MQSTGDLWCTTNERDALGDNLVPDYSTRVKEGGFYGWPWYYMGNKEDPRHAGERPDLAGKTITPDVPYQAHSAAVGFTFYAASNGKSAFPAEYVGDAFAVFHGSWDPATTGHKVVRTDEEREADGRCRLSNRLHHRGRQALGAAVEHRGAARRVAALDRRRREFDLPNLAFALSVRHEIPA
jgi:glucose/arabinose dehydrogenase